MLFYIKREGIEIMGILYPLISKTFFNKISVLKIGAYHKAGGRQSTCEISHPYEVDDFGIALAEFLNKPQEPSQ